MKGGYSGLLVSTTTHDGGEYRICGLAAVRTRKKNPSDKGCRAEMGECLF